MSKNSFTTLTADLNNIQKLDDLPNADGHLSAAELKAEFDKAGNAIKDYINNTLIGQLARETASDSGASKIGIEEIVGIAGVTNVQDALIAILASAQSGVVTDASVYTNAIQDSAVTTPKHADGSVTTAKLANGAATVPKVDLTTDALTFGKASTLNTMNGGLIVDSSMYGDNLPGTPTAGRLFFKKVQ